MIVILCGAVLGLNTISLLYWMYVLIRYWNNPRAHRLGRMVLTEYLRAALDAAGIITCLVYAALWCVYGGPL